MKATHLLIEEHQVIERVLSALEAAALTLDSDDPVGPEFFFEAATFVRGFADGCHHKKEEHILFTSMANHGIAMEGGPIGVMLAEHEQGRHYIRAMQNAAERWAAGDPAARTEVARNALNYVALLRQHIAKENNVLFPLAEEAIPEDELNHLAEHFEHLEHEETGSGVHEKYLKLAERLCGESLS